MESLEMNSSTFWQNKSVFLTGHTGFKGAWLSIYLDLLKAKVTGYSLSPLNQTNLFDAANVESKINHIIGDIRDFEQLKQQVFKAQPQIIFHLAAQALVRPSYHAPLETYSTNVMGTAHVLEAARQCASVRCVVVITSDKCYENREWVWGYRENDPMGGYDPYSSSKGAAELVTQAYYSSYFSEKNDPIGVASARAGNVIGGGDWAEDRLVPDFVRAVEQQIAIVLRNPLATRPWQHVLEPLTGYLQLAEKLFDEPQKYSGAWNFGPEENDIRSVQWVIEFMEKLWDGALSWELDKAAQPHEAQLLKLDCSKVHSKLAWIPKWQLEQALEQTVAWYQAYLSQKYDMQDVCLSQIKAYLDT
ncbi:CDP-glucose 4,6-dehydratase [Candidatus Venteria ishoeyi]|uniref:CDP-glucose 4,6-dehydratase n=1 Tax=Candidatus Venteria ishoeyi TaxID=1899563 RepID=UPI000AC99EB3|nr:CDP-glucose 4,6-dehydratase [Candidatus Venteria ishoeyi]